MLQWQLASTFYVIFCINSLSAASFRPSEHIQELYNARIQTLPAYAIVLRADLINSTCGKELKIFRAAIDQQILWSLKVLDSSGVFKPGFLYGNNYWIGSLSQCLDTMNTVHLQILQRKMLNNTLFRKLQQKFPPFQINYFVAHFRHNSTLQYYTLKYENVITLGLCLPASCTSNEISFILEKSLDDILIGDPFSMKLQLIQVKDLKDDYKWLSNGATLFICMSLAFFMVIIGTMYDIFVHQKHVKKNELKKTDKNVNNISKEIEENVRSSHVENKIGKVLICFSAYTNTRKIFNMELKTGTIPAIHGLKFLNMCLIITLHNIYYALDFFDNKVWFRIWIENYFPSVVNCVSILVDNYFFSSGCLTTYLYLRNKTNVELNKSTVCRENLIEFFTHIIKRFIRLTPAYMMVLGLSQLSFARFDKTSQFYIYERTHETCPKYWWRNILYINNLFDVNEMCISWSWYLASDMQFHVIGMTLLILSTEHFYAAATILSAILIGSAVLSGYISYVYEYVPTIDELYRLVDVLYTPPWMRINPYLLGIIAGYILIKLNSNLVLKKKVVILCWCFAGAFNIYVIASHRRHVLDTAIYVVLHRIFWALSTAWIVIACTIKHGGIVNQLLSFKGWIPFSKLTYCAYLLNPVIIRSVNFCSSIPIQFNLLPFLVTSVGYVILTYICSYALSLIVEIPYISLTRMFIYNHHKIHKKKL